MHKDIRIVFMGTPEFAVPALRILYETGYTIAAVITAPDKPSGRGLQMKPSPVKQFAEANNIPVLQPLKLRDPDFLKQLESFNANLQIVVAFRMLPEIVWNMPPMGTLNLHASLLPDYRGAAPINWAIINGETETGLTTFFLRHAIDTGDIILQEKIKIKESDDAGSLHDTMMLAGAALVLKTVEVLQAGPVVTREQNEVSLKKAPKIFKEDCRIQWNGDCLQIVNFVRGLSPYPAAFTVFEDKLLKVFRVSMETISHPEKAGLCFTDHKTYLKYSAMNGFIYIDELQPEGKKRMRTADFFRGYRK